VSKAIRPEKGDDEMGGRRRPAGEKKRGTGSGFDRRPPCVRLSTCVYGRCLEPNRAAEGIGSQKGGGELSSY